MKKLLNYFAILFFAVSAIFMFAGCEVEDEESVENEKNVDVVEEMNDKENIDVVVDRVMEEALEKELDVSVEGGDVVIETELGKVSIDEDTNNGYLVNAEIITDVADISAQKPEDLPTLEKGTNFNWAGAEGNGMLSYKLKENDYGNVCEEQLGLLKQKGWSMDDGVAIQFSGSSTSTLNKEGYILSLTCTEESGDENMVTVTMVKGVNS